MTISGTAKLGTKNSGACFEKGKTYPTQLYMDWIDWYLQYVRENDCSPSERQVSRQFDISRKTAKKVCEFASNKTNYLHNIPFYAKGYGSRLLSEDEQIFLIYIYKNFPSSTLSQYCYLLNEYSGKKVHESTICRWLKYSFRYKSSIRKTSIYHKNKFTNYNIVRLINYLNFIKQVSPYRLVFTDEKPLRGIEIFAGGRNRRCPLTGVTPHIATTVKIKNNFNLTAAIKVRNVEGEQVFYQVGTYSGNAIMFRSFVLNMIRSHFLVPGDILVCDNARIHTGSDCTYLRDDMWECCGIILLLLPTYHPELNPIELIFNILIQRIRHNGSRYLDYVRRQDNVILKQCCDVLDNLTRHDITSVYRKCGYL